jgi:hypothetical protein
MRENYYLDDGTYSASQIVILMVQRALEGRGKDVAADLLRQLPEPAEAREFRLKLKARPDPNPTLTLSHHRTQLMADFHKPSRQLPWASMRPLASQLRPCAARALPPNSPKDSAFLDAGAGAGFPGAGRGGAGQI